MLVDSSASASAVVSSAADEDSAFAGAAAALEVQRVVGVDPAASYCTMTLAEGTRAVGT